MVPETKPQLPLKKGKFERKRTAPEITNVLDDATETPQVKRKSRSRPKKNRIRGEQPNPLNDSTVHDVPTVMNTSSNEKSHVTLIKNGISGALINKRSFSTDGASEAVVNELSPSTLPSSDSHGSSTKHLSDVEFESLSGVSIESKKAIAEVLKYKYLTKVQLATLENVVSGKDVMAKAKTGTGKTIAFLLPMIERIIEQRTKSSNSSRSICGLVLSPTRELALQISKEAQALTTFHSNITIGCFIGGMNIRKDIQKLQNGIDILVITPGRFIDHLQNDNEGIRERVKSVQVVVFDEADQLLDMGFKKSIDTILTYLQAPDDRQTLMYSATFTDSVKSMAQRALKSSHIFVDTIEVGDQQTNTHVMQQSIICPMNVLTKSLESIILEQIATQKDYKILVFFNTARTAGYYAQLFQFAGYNVLEMHSRKSQKYREKMAKEFHTGKNVMMFSSDVSARGVDYPDVTLIIQVGLTDKEQYIHRLGRTGRAGRAGRGILLLCEFERNFLKELKDLDITPVECELADTSLLKASKSSLMLPNDMPDTLQVAGQQAYQAYLGYYNSNAKRLGLSKQSLVELANDFSCTIGFQKPPTLKKSVIGKMGLKGVPGLRCE